MTMQEKDEMNIVFLWTILWKRKKWVAAMVVGGTLLCAVVSLFLTNQYTSSAKIMPVGGGGMDGNMAALSGVASFMGVSVGGRTPASQLVAILRSRSLTELVVREAGLIQDFYGEEAAKGEPSPAMMAGAIRRVKKMLRLQKDMESGVVDIGIQTNNPELAHKVGEAYINSLRTIINQNAFTMAKRNRLFIEKQLLQNKRDLLEAGKLLNRFYQEGRVSSVNSTVDVPLFPMAESDSEQESPLDPVALAQADLEHSDFMVEFEALQGKKKALEEQIVDKTVKEVPQQVYLQYLTLRRNLLGELHLFLAKSYESAKIEEAKDEFTFQVLDRPTKPLNHSSPDRKLMIQLAVFVSFFASIFIVFLVEYWLHLKEEMGSVR